MPHKCLRLCFFNSLICGIAAILQNHYISLMAIRILIFEDNDRLRESLAYMLDTMPDFEVAGHYSHCMDAHLPVHALEPDVVLMDIDMPGENGINGVKMVKEARPQTAVIMYTVFEDDEKLFQCLCAGANGYLLKKTPADKLFDAIREVTEGGAPMSPNIARKVISTFQNTKTAKAYSLSSRELDVLQLLAKGYSAKSIGKQLFISSETVRSHLKNIYQKLHVNCGKEAIAKALGEHIV
jgi:DNA-binding NarL/FixJ family response regulator